MIQQKKAVALISGGLDSMLAAKMMLEQGIHVEGINFYTGFCVEGHTHAIRNQDRKKPKRNNALWVAQQLGIKLHIVDIVEPYKEVVLNPKYGYGAHLNPCLDCKIFMVKEAKKWLKENQFDFIITGEVMGQRPKSQLKKAMQLVNRETETQDILLRPLSAQNLEPTLPEREGWVDRNRLLGISGRSRAPQIKMAADYQIQDYAQPAGGCCFLTHKQYSDKLQDLWQHRGEKKYELDDIMLLKVGRHLRPKPTYKMIIGRDEGENRFLQGYKRQFTHLECLSHHGPLALIDGDLPKEDYNLVASIVGRYSQGREESQISVKLVQPNGVQYLLSVKPLGVTELPDDWILT